MCTAFSSRQSLVSQSWRTSSSSGRSLRSRRAFSSFGVISLMGVDHRGGPRYGPPHPPALVAPRVNRGAPRSRAVDTGPRYGPPHPPALVAPRVNRGAPRSRAVDTGPRYGPPHPPALVAPRVNRGAPRSRAVGTGPRYGPPDCSSEGGYAPLGLPRPTLGRAPAEPWRASDGGPHLGDIQKSGLSSAWRRPADQEVGEPAVHDLRVLDVRKVAARVEPAHAAAREALGGLRTVRGGDGRILAAVDQEHGHVERGDGAPIVGAALDEIVGERAYRAQPRPACGRRGAGRVLPADEEGHLVGGRRVETSRDGRAIERRAAAAGQGIAEPGRRHQPRAPARLPAEARHAAREQGQPLDAGGTRERVGHRDGRAERVADDRHLRDADGVEEGVQRSRKVGERVRGGRLAGAPEAREVHRVHGGARGERGDGVAPGGGEAAETVHEDNRGTAAFDQVVQREAVDLAAPEPQFRHGARILPDRLRRRGG